MKKYLFVVFSSPPDNLLYFFTFSSSYETLHVLLTLPYLRLPGKLYFYFFLILAIVLVHKRDTKCIIDHLLSKMFMFLYSFSEKLSVYFLKMYLPFANIGDVVAQWLVRRTLDQEVESSNPGRCVHVVFSGKTLSSHCASLHPGV